MVNQSDKYNKIAKNSKSLYAHNFKVSTPGHYVSDMLSELKWLSVKQPIIFLTVVIVYKIKNFGQVDLPNSPIPHSIIHLWWLLCE